MKDNTLNIYRIRYKNDSKFSSYSAALAGEAADRLKPKIASIFFIIAYTLRNTIAPILFNENALNGSIPTDSAFMSSYT